MIKAREISPHGTTKCRMSIPCYQGHTTGEPGLLLMLPQPQQQILPSHPTACLCLYLLGHHQKPWTPRPSLLTWSLTSIQLCLLPDMDQLPTLHTVKTLDLQSNHQSPAKCCHKPSLQVFASPLVPNKMSPSLKNLI